MSCDVVYTVAMLAELKKAYASGAKTVEYNDKKVEYRTLEEMAALIRELEDKLCGPQANGSRRFFKVYATHSKGLY